MSRLHGDSFHPKSQARSLDDHESPCARPPSPVTQRCRFSTFSCTSGRPIKRAHARPRTGSPDSDGVLRQGVLGVLWKLVADLVPLAFKPTNMCAVGLS